MYYFTSENQRTRQWGCMDQRFSKCGPGPEALSWNLLEMRNQKSGDEGQQSVV